MAEQPLLCSRMDTTRPMSARPDPTLTCWRFYRRPIAVLVFAMLLEMIAVYYFTVHSSANSTRGLDYLGLWIHIMSGVGLMIAMILFIRSTIHYRRLRQSGRWQPVPVAVPYIRPIIGTTDSTTAICVSPVYAPTTVPVSYASANPSSSDTIVDSRTEDVSRHDSSRDTTEPSADSLSNKRPSGDPPSYNSLFK